MVREQAVAFVLIDFENLITELETEGIISTDEYSELTNMKNKILKRCGFTVESKEGDESVGV